MSHFAFLIPLGLLGLLGIVALIIIYIIKPNYLMKHISSTYVWKLSLKYRRKKIPTSKIRNLLIFLCQLLILTAIAGILSKPAIVYEVATTSSDYIAIIDSSASMYAGENETRFERAVNRVIERTDTVTQEGGNMTVILADTNPSFLGRRVDSTEKYKLDDELYTLLDSPDTACSYGTANMERAMELCEEILADNPSALIEIYTDTTYAYVPNGIQVFNVGEEGEWNAAILSANVELEDNYYTLTIDVASYGNDREVEVNVEVSGANSIDANDAGRYITFSESVDCSFGETQTLIFKYGVGEGNDTIHYFDLGDDNRFYSYQSIHISIGEEDCFAVDNSFDIFGGQKEILKVQYASGGEVGPNPFMNAVLMVLTGRFRREGSFDMQVTEVKKGSPFETEGFDVYIFEHTMPATMPTDGVVFLLDPDSAPAGSGFRIRQTVDFHGQQFELTGPEEEHPALRDINPSDITISRYVQIDPDFPDEVEVLLTIDGYPAVMVEKSGDRQIVVVTFDVHYSNVSITTEYFELYRNLFDYYLPYAVTSNSYEVGESISLQSRGPEIKISGNGIEEKFTEFPASITVTLPGTYTVAQTSYFDKEIPALNIFVKIPSIESNTAPEMDSVPEPFRAEAPEESIDDLMIYLAAALVAILFLEWWLQMREGR